MEYIFEKAASAQTLAYYELGCTAHRADVLVPHVAVASSQFTGLVIGMLANPQIEPLRDAIIANWLGSETLDERLDLIKCDYHQSILEAAGKIWKQSLHEWCLSAC